MGYGSSYGKPSGMPVCDRSLDDPGLSASAIGSRDVVDRMLRTSGMLVANRSSGDPGLR